MSCTAVQGESATPWVASMGDGAGNSSCWCAGAGCELVWPGFDNVWHSQPILLARWDWGRICLQTISHLQLAWPQPFRNSPGAPPLPSQTPSYIHHNGYSQKSTSNICLIILDCCLYTKPYAWFLWLLHVCSCPSSALFSPPAWNEPVYVKSRKNHGCEKPV